MQQGKRVPKQAAPRALRLAPKLALIHEERREASNQRLDDRAGQSESAGTVVYERGQYGVRILLILEDAGWGIPKGKCESGESPRQAAQRETYEETGIRAGYMRFLTMGLTKKNCRPLFCFMTRYESSQISKVALPKGVRKSKLVSLDQAKKMIVAHQLPLLAAFSDIMEQR